MNGRYVVGEAPNDSQEGEEAKKRGGDSRAGSKTRRPSSRRRDSSGSEAVPETYCFERTYKGRAIESRVEFYKVTPKTPSYIV